jgi:AcrR family transcriptional regulator
MARTLSPDHQVQREQILEQAASAFASQGYHGTSMNDLAHACGTSKARLYHYYPGKEAILFDLLDRYTQTLLNIAAQHLDLDALIAAFLQEYEHSQTRHIALLNDVKFLAEPQRQRILDAQRAVVQLVSDRIEARYPGRRSDFNRSAVTMLLFGMINWTFTWLRPHHDGDGKMRYADFATLVSHIFGRGMEGLAQEATRAL